MTLAAVALALAAQQVPPEAPRVRKRAEVAACVARTPGWTLSETAHYFVVTDVCDRGFLDVLRERLEAIRKEYQRWFPHPDLDPVTPAPAPDVVRLVRNADEFHSYGGPAGSVGYWSANAGEVVLADDPTGREAVLSNLQSLAFLEYIGTLHGKPPPHPWFLHGHADVYGGLARESGAFLLRPSRARLDDVREMIRKGTVVPLREFVRFGQAEYYGTNARGATSGENFAEGWALVYFLRTGAGISPGWVVKWGSILPTYYRVFSEKHDPAAALEAAFHGVDWAALEASWRAHFAEPELQR